MKRGRPPVVLSGIIDFVRKNEGCTTAAMRALNYKNLSSLLVYACKSGLLHKSGRRRDYRYYTDAEVARREHDLHVQEAIAILEAAA